MPTSTTYAKELQRLHKGIRIAWALDTGILALTYEAAMVFMLLSSKSTNDEIGGFLTTTIPLSIILALITVLILKSKSSRLLMDAPAGNTTRIKTGVVYNITEEMAIAANMKVPEVYIANGTGVVNAYAVSDGRTNRIIITSELLDLVSRDELQGIIGHEMGHLASGDSQAMTTLVAMTSMTSIITGSVIRINSNRDNDRNSNPLAILLIILSFIFLLISPLLAKLSESYMSRERESNADMLSVKYTNNPDSLANALIRITQNKPKENRSAQDKFNNIAGAVAFYNPSFALTATHPKTEDRIALLERMGAQLHAAGNLSVGDRMRLEASNE